MKVHETRSHSVYNGSWGSWNDWAALFKSCIAFASFRYWTYRSSWVMVTGAAEEVKSGKWKVESTCACRPCCLDASCRRVFDWDSRGRAVAGQPVVYDGAGRKWQSCVRAKLRVLSWRQSR